MAFKKPMDIRTLVVMTAIMSLGSAISVYIIHRLRFSVNGILFWVYGSFVITCSLILLAFRGILPDFITIIMANTFISYGFALTWDKLAQTILEIRPQTPIILCTGYSDRISKERAQVLGIKKYIEKPIENETLAKSVREVLDAGPSKTEPPDLDKKS